MPIEGVLTLLLVAGLIGIMMFSRAGTDVVLMGGLTLLLIVPIPKADGWVMGILTIKDAFSGFSNPGMLTVAVLFVVVAGLQETGGVDWIAQRLLGRPKSVLGAQLRMMLPVAGISAFMNNTPVVAMFIPVVNDWARKFNISPSKLMIPLSFATVLGGMCTLIGTSTNIIVNGLIVSETDLPGLHLFDITSVGLPAAAAGLIYLTVVGRWLLPDRKSVHGILENPREYTIEFMVEEKSPLIGKSIEQAGLRHLTGAYLIEIDRNGDILVAVGPEQRLEANDRLVFAGVVDSVKDLQKIRGLKPATDQVFKLDAPRHYRCLIEAVVSDVCPMVGKSIREGRFRTQYNAAIIAVARNGERIKSKIGDIVLRPGDMLLLEALPSFVEYHRNSKDFFLVSAVEDSVPRRHDRAPVAIAILAVMIVVASFEWLNMLIAGMLAAGMMILARTCTVSAARRSIDWSVLVAIAASLGIGRAIEVSGAADYISNAGMDAVGGRPWAALAVIYVLTVILTEVVTNNAAAALMFPFAVSGAQALGVDPMPMIIAVMMGASAGFATPLGYQTHLMVYGPGGYVFSDYVKIGVPLDIFVGIVTILVIPWAWPF